MSDSVTLTIPRNPQYYGVVRLVVGGLAAGLSLSLDALDDLWLAIGSLLDNEDLPVDDDVTLRLEVRDDALIASLGTFAAQSADKAFDRAHPDGPEFGLRRMLDTIVDDVDIRAHDDGEWITLTKRVRAAV